MKHMTNIMLAASNRAVSSALAGGNVAQNAGKGKSSSKAWIAGAVIGPVLGLLLVGALVWFCLRRRKNKNKLTAPQQGGALMASVDPSHPPVSEDTQMRNHSLRRSNKRLSPRIRTPIKVLS
jgi:hypothetical protein